MDAWENVTVSGTLASTLGVDNPFRYRGYYYDKENGLYYLKSRYYNPQIGRFINADDPCLLFLSGKEIQRTNVFSYVKNNSVMYVDPTGYAYIGVNKIKYNWWGFDVYLNSTTVKLICAGNWAACQFLKKIPKYGQIIFWAGFGVRTLLNIKNKGRGVIMRYLYFPVMQLYWIKSQ